MFDPIHSGIGDTASNMLVKRYAGIVKVTPVRLRAQWLNRGAFTSAKWWRIPTFRSCSAPRANRDPLTRPKRFKVRRAIGSQSSADIPAPNTAITCFSAELRSVHKILSIEPPVSNADAMTASRQQNRVMILHEDDTNICNFARYDSTVVLRLKLCD